MEQENNNSAVVQSKKDMLASYVHDAVEMEVSRHTLNELRDSIIDSREHRVYAKKRIISSIAEKHQREIKEKENGINDIKDSHKKSLSAMQQTRDGYNKIIDETNTPPPPFTFWFEDAIGWIVGCLLAFPFVIGVPLLLSLPLVDDGTMIITIVGLIITGALFGLLLSYLIKKSQWESSCESDKNNKEAEKTKYTSLIKSLDNEIQSELKKQEKELDEATQEYNQLISKLLDEELTAKEKLTHAQRTYDELTPHIEAMGKQLDTMDSQLSQFYAVNLIPPDYRSLECVIAFDQMFRNDLVDTMRDAVLLYEERVFRGEMVKGLENIRRAIGNLSALMAETVTVLNRIDNNTKRMSDQLYTISSDITRMNANVTGHLSTISGNISSLGSSLDYIADNQQNIASELEYSRYANDAIRANSDRMIWYAEQRRQGLL